MNDDAGSERGEAASGPRHLRDGGPGGTVAEPEPASSPDPTPAPPSDKSDQRFVPAFDGGVHGMMHPRSHRRAQHPLRPTQCHRAQSLSPDFRHLVKRDCHSTRRCGLLTILRPSATHHRPRLSIAITASQLVSAGRLLNKGDFARAMRGGIPRHAVDGTSLIALPNRRPRNEPSNQPNGER
jgi:hypothetical protein